jgi:hypothetical protein
MLQVISSMPSKGCTLEIDDYVPFVFRCENTHSSTPLYWRTGDFKSSLIEIGLNPNSGAICCIKIPFFEKKPHKIDSNWTKPTRNLTEGIPVCNIQKWPSSENFSDSFRDNPLPLTITVGIDFITFYLETETKVHSFYIAGQLCIGVDEKQRILQITFVAISEKDLNRIALT